MKTKPKMQIHKDTNIEAAIKKTQLHRMTAAGMDEVIIDDVIVEEIFVVRIIDEKGAMKELKLLCTPIDVKELVIGALFSENMINNFNDIKKIDTKLNVIDVKIGCVFQNVLNSGFGSDNLSFDLPKLCQRIAPPNNKLLKSISMKKIIALINRLQSEQQIFRKTGAAHAALLFVPTKGGVESADTDENESNEKTYYFAEDIGRHNAIDKVIGKCLLDNGTMLKGCGIALSSRVSFELVTKVARAGIELIVAVSAPSSLAILAADYWQITLCAFARGDKVNVYTHAWRIC